MEKYCWFTLALQFMSSFWRLDTDFLHRNEEEQDLVVKDILGMKPIFGYATDFLNGHTGKSLSQSCQDTAIKLQHRAACVSSQHKYQLHPSPHFTYGSAKLKTQLEQSSDLGAPPNSRLLHSICYRQVPQTWRQLPAHGENWIISVTGKKSLGNQHLTNQ